MDFFGQNIYNIIHAYFLQHAVKQSLL